MATTSRRPTAASAPAPLDDTTEALRAQLAQVTTQLLDQQAQLAALEAAQPAPASATPAAPSLHDALDAELDALQREFADYPLIETITRRVLHGADANLDLRLRGEPPLHLDPEGQQRTWTLRWFNFGKEGRAQQATAEGYEKVRWEELQEPDSIAGGATSDSYVWKGERGIEVLCKIPRKLYAYKKRRDAATHAGVVQSESRLRHHLANTVASRAGAVGDNADQAGSFVQSRGFDLSITAGPTERVTY